MNIGYAVEAMQEGARVARPGWNGKGMYLFIQKGGPISNRTRVYQDYVVMKTAQDTYVPWLCSQSDLLADDWEIVDG